MADHDHDPDSFEPGSRYEVRIRLPGGFLLRSTPMLGEEAMGLMQALKGEKYPGIGYTLMPVAEAVERLRSDAQVLRGDAQSTEDTLVPQHRGFQKNADDNWASAAKFEERAKFLERT